MAGTSTPPSKHKPSAAPSGAKTTTKSSTSGAPTSPTKKKPASAKKKATPANPSSRALVVVDNNAKNPSAANAKATKPASVKKAAPAVASSSKKLQPVVPEQDKREKERRDNEDYDKKRKFYICGAIFCCFILLLILGLVLGLVVFKNDDNNDNATANQGIGNGGNEAPNTSPNASPNGPTSNVSPTIPNFPTQAPIPIPPSGRVPTEAPVPPTAAPVAPPPVPTTPAPIPAPVFTPTSLLQPSPSRLIIIPDADTYVQRDGFTPFEAYGTEDTFLVQNGPAAVNEIPDVVGLLQFDISVLPGSYSQVTLQLFHEPASRNRGAAVLTIRLLASTPLAVETFHAGIFNPTDDEGTFGPNFSVSPDDTIVQVDITNLVRNHNDDQLFLMIENRGEEQPEGATGDRFFTRESNDPPQLIVSL